MRHHFHVVVVLLPKRFRFMFVKLVCYDVSPSSPCVICIVPISSSLPFFPSCCSWMGVNSIASFVLRVLAIAAICRLSSCWPSSTVGVFHRFSIRLRHLAGIGHGCKTLRGPRRSTFCPCWLSSSQEPLHSPLAH